VKIKGLLGNVIELKINTTAQEYSFITDEGDEHKIVRRV
jgi:hypothetical protein